MTDRKTLDERKADALAALEAEGYQEHDRLVYDAQGEAWGRRETMFPYSHNPCDTAWDDAPTHQEVSTCPIREKEEFEFRGRRWRVLMNVREEDPHRVRNLFIALALTKYPVEPMRVSSIEGLRPFRKLVLVISAKERQVLELMLRLVLVGGFTFRSRHLEFPRRVETTLEECAESAVLSVMKPWSEGGDMPRPNMDLSLLTESFEIPNTPEFTRKLRTFADHHRIWRNVPSAELTALYTLRLAFLRGVEDFVDDVLERVSWAEKEKNSVAELCGKLLNLWPSLP